MDDMTLVRCVAPGWRELYYLCPCASADRTERIAIHGKTLAARQPTSHSTAAAAENHFPQGET
jgi:hypothetical protein